jgi:glycine oxidase
MKSYDVLVIGGGIIGGSIAFRLAQQNLSVALLDQQDFGREASWAAAGMLSPAPDSSADIPLVPFGRASLGLYPAFVEEVEEVSELAAHYRPRGAMELFFSADAERRLSTLVALHHALGLPTEPLPLDEARKLEPALGREVRAAALLPYEASVDNRALTLAVLAAAASSDVTMLPNTGVTELLHHAHKCTGVLAGGETYTAGNVVLAAGAFSGKIAGLSPALATRPIRGQMLAFRSAAARLRGVVRSEHAYLVPRDDAESQWIVAGSTIEDAGFEKRVTPQGIEHILSAIQEMVPELAGAEITETWCGLRPDTPDHLPLLGPARLQNLAVATGHYRNGILLAPITAKLICEWITEGRVSMDWEIFNPERFANAQAAPGAR